MPTIHLTTFIDAPPSVVFVLSRSIEMHQLSTKQTQEKVVAGRMSGLITLGETVTWRAKHFGVFQELTAKVTAFDQPNAFTDEMVSGAFKSFKHVHLFEAVDTGTKMIDVFSYVSPLGLLGKLADILFLERYMERLLINRNLVIKSQAELR